MKALTVLKRARAKLADPKRWTKGGFARDREDQLCEPSAPEACKWDIYGALVATAAERSVGEAHRALVDQIPRGRGRHLVVWNDSQRTDHADVLALFDRAIIVETSHAIRARRKVA